MNTTSSAAALTAHVEATNAKGQAWAAAAVPGEFRAAAEYSTSPEYWATFSVFTPADFDRQLAMEDYSDLYKSCHGFRPHGLSAMTMEDLQEGLANLSSYANSMADQWAEQARLDEIRFAEWLAEDRWNAAIAHDDFSFVRKDFESLLTDPSTQAPIGSIGFIFKINGK